jgi:hypothetical protein
MTKHHRLVSGLAVALAAVAGLASPLAVAQPQQQPVNPAAAAERPAPAPDALLDDIVRVMSGNFVSDELRIIATPMRATDADRVLFVAAETGSGDTMGQVFFHVFRLEGEPRVRMVRIPGGVAAAPGLYAAMDAIGPVTLSQLDVTGDLIPTFDEATDSLTLSTNGMFPTYAGGAIAMKSHFTFTPSGMTIEENGFDHDGGVVWSFPEGGKGDLNRQGAAPVAKKSDSGLRMLTIKEGDSSAAIGKAGDTYTVHYTGWLPSGQLFDTSKQPGREPFTIQIPGGVIQGWNEGLVGMKVGETRRLFIPPSLGYGERGAGGVIPPNSWLVFDVELLGLNNPAAAPAQPPAQQNSGDMSHDHDGDGIPDH